MGKVLSAGFLDLMEHMEFFNGQKGKAFFPQTIYDLRKGLRKEIARHHGMGYPPVMEEANSPGSDFPLNLPHNLLWSLFVHIPRAYLPSYKDQIELLDYES